MGDDFDVMAAILAGLAGETPEVPYLLSDMAADAMAVLDAVGVEGARRGHVDGRDDRPAGGDRPPRTVASLTSIMSTTG